MASSDSRDPRIPDKHYFRIGEVGEIAGVETYVLRFWETEFPSLTPQKSRSKQRQYSVGDVELVLRIRDLLYEAGFTIEGARKQLMDKPLQPPVPARTQGALARIQIEVEELLRLAEE